MSGDAPSTACWFCGADAESGRVSIPGLDVGACEKCSPKLFGLADVITKYGRSLEVAAFRAGVDAGAVWLNTRATALEERAAHAAANPVPGCEPDVHAEIVEGIRETASQCRIDAVQVRMLPLPESMAGAAVAAETALRAHMEARVEAADLAVRRARARERVEKAKARAARATADVITRLIGDEDGRREALERVEPDRMLAYLAAKGWRSHAELPGDMLKIGGVGGVGVVPPRSRGDKYDKHVWLTALLVSGVEHRRVELVVCDWLAEDARASLGEGDEAVESEAVIAERAGCLAAVREVGELSTACGATADVCAGRIMARGPVR